MSRSTGTRPNKAQRQHRIAKLLEEHRVTNQAHLVELLAVDGVDVNVSTVSRDLEELGAIKVRIPGGETAYAVPEMPREQVAPADHLRRVLGDWVVEVARSGDIVVVRMFYQWPLFVTGLGYNISNLAGSKRLLSATAAFRNEPFLATAPC